MEHDDEGEDVLDDDQEEERAEDKAEGEEGEVCDQGDGSDNEQAKKQEEEMMYGVVWCSFLFVAPYIWKRSLW